MTLEQLQKQKKDLEQIKEYQCGDHPTRILCVSNITARDLSYLYTLLHSHSLVNHPHIKSIFLDELEEFHFILIAFYDLRQAISTHKMLLKTQKYQVHYALAKDVLDDKEQNQGTIVVFNIDYSVTNDEIKDLFGTCGDIKELRETPLKKHHRFVEFFDLRDAQRAINELNQYELKGRKLKIEPSRPYGIRQRVLTSCANVLGMSENIIGLPPPQEMMKFVCRKIKEIDSYHYTRNRKPVQETYYSKNKSKTYTSPKKSSSTSSFTPSNEKDEMKSKSPLIISTSSSISLDCLSSLPSVSNNEPESTQNQMFYELYQPPHLSSTSSSTSIFNELSNMNNLTDMNNNDNNFNEMNEFQSIKPLQSFEIDSSPFQTPTKQSNQMKKKDDNSVINVPKPTSVGQELSKQYSKETIGTPHLPEKRFNYFTNIELKGLGIDKTEDIDEMKRVLVIENIPITFTYHELLERIEKSISCFYDQFCPIVDKDKLTYKCIIRVTNQMVMDNFMLHFNNIFLENDQDDLCVVHEIECQGKCFVARKLPWTYAAKLCVFTAAASGKAVQARRK